MENLSYKNLPSIDEIKEILISQAVLDIILTEEENHWLRLINFYKNYSKGLDMVKIDNIAGDHVYILFSDEGAIIKGFDHESILSPYANDEGKIAKGIYESVPNELMKLLDDSVEVQDVTFCIWRKRTDMFWCKGEVTVPDDYKNGDDGEDFLLGYIFQDADSWLEWAQGYYDEQGKIIKIDHVKKVYEHQNITKEIVESINPDRDFEEVNQELKKIGYTK